MTTIISSQIANRRESQRKRFIREIFVALVVLWKKTSRSN
jgi:hypothetical protein